jgi:nicotinamide-nucleotide amidase
MGGTTRAALVAVGNELLYGETVDTNTSWLGRVLTEWGLEVVGAFTVRDHQTEIQVMVRYAMDLADVVIVTGGLGPTADDVTKAAVAELLGLRLVVDPTVQHAVAERFRAAGSDSVPRLSEGQSEVFEGASALANELGTAPGILLEREHKALVLLPGIPGEMMGIVTGSLKDAWAGRWPGEGASHHVIHTTGLEEPHLAEMVDVALERLPAAVLDDVSVAYLPDELGVDIRLTVRAQDASAASARFAEVERVLGPAIEKWRFEAEGGDIVEAVSHELRRTGLTLAAAESCTGGLLAKRVTALAGASDFFVGAVVSYANSVKIGQLSVSEADLDRYGAVSEPVACGMASGVAEELDADVGLGITGVAGPGGGTPEKPIGTVWIALSIRGVVSARRHLFPGDRGEIRRRSVQAALMGLYKRLSEMPTRA